MKQFRSFLCSFACMNAFTNNWWKNLLMEYFYVSVKIVRDLRRLLMQCVLSVQCFGKRSKCMCVDWLFMFMLFCNDSCACIH